MNTDEILLSLTTLQRKELEEKLHQAAADATLNFNKDPKKFGLVTQKIQLSGAGPLQVTASLVKDDKGKLYPIIEEILMA